MPSPRSVVLAGALVAWLASTGVGRADPPCVADIKKLCSNVPATAAKIQACLQENEAQLSKECAGHVANLRKNAQQLAAICVWDIERFCPDVAPGQGRIVSCLQTNKDSLSPICKEQFNKAKD